MDAHTSKTPPLSDPQRRALTFAHAGVLYYRTDSFGHGYYGEQDCAPVRIRWNTFEAIERRGWVVREPHEDQSLRGGTVTILAYVLTDAGRTALGVERDEISGWEKRPQDEAPGTVHIADVQTSMSTEQGWVDFIDRSDSGWTIVYYLPFDLSAKTCRAWPPGTRVMLVPCPHIPNVLDHSRCAKCGHELGSVAA